jgi:hypothetical protein
MVFDRVYYATLILFLGNLSIHADLKGESLIYHDYTRGMFWQDAVMNSLVPFYVLMQVEEAPALHTLS